jgi:hypothetical protein
MREERENIKSKVRYHCVWVGTKGKKKREGKY